MNLGRLLWGIIVIFIGVVFLLINFGYLEASVWANIWQLWPLILVGIGLSILSRSLSEAGKIILNILAILILLTALILVISPNNRIYSRITTSKQSSEIKSETIDEELTGSNNPLSVVIKTGASKLNISGSTQKFAQGELQSNFTELEINRLNTAKEDKLEILTNVRHRVVGFDKNDLNLALNGQLPLSLELNTGALDGKLDLSNLNLKSLIIKSGASSYDISLGDRADLVKGELSVGASSIALNVPKNVGLKFTSNSGLSSNNFEKQDLKRNDDTYTSENYDSATKKIELIFKTGASSIELERF
jgi:hypothetical protein